MAGVLVFITDQMLNGVGDRVGDAVVLEQFRGPPLQVVEVRHALSQEQVPVAAVASPQGGVERVPGTDQLLGVDELVAQPFEVFAAVAHHQVRLFPTPALPLQHVQVGAEDVVVMTGQEAPLLILVQHRKVRSETGALGVGAQDPAAQAVDGADPHPGEVSRVTGRGGQRDEPLFQLAGRGPRVGAQHQLLRSRTFPQQDVRAPQRHRQRLAGAGTGYTQGGAVQMPDEFQLAPVQPRVPAQYGGRHARGVVVHVVVHVDVLLIDLSIGLELGM